MKLIKRLKYTEDEVYCDECTEVITNDQMMKVGYYNCSICHSDYHKDCVNLNLKNFEKFENLSR